MALPEGELAEKMTQRELGSVFADPQLQTRHLRPDISSN